MLIDITKFKKSIYYLWRQISLSNYDKIFCNKSLIGKYKHLNKKNVLFQMPEEYFYLIIFDSIIQNLKKKTDLQIHWININTDYQKVGKSYLLKKIIPFGLRWTKLYKSLGGSIELDYEFGIFNWFKYLKESYSIYSNLKTKQDLLELKISGILVGDLIYDSYLRYRCKPTVDIKDKYLFRLIISALYIVNKSSEYFSKNKPDALFTSYTAYLHHGVPVRIALSLDIPVYSFGAREIYFNKVDLAFPFHLKDFSKYGEDLLNISKDHLNILNTQSKKLLEFRLSGGKDSATYYMKNSSFSSDIDKSTFFSNISKHRVVIFTHDFYDSPHVRRWLLFEDFYEWLIFILKSANYLNEYFVKLHPNSSIETINIIKDILVEFPMVKLIPLNLSTTKLINEGFDLAITNHGTVGHEMPIFNIPVLCSGDNPHITFNFCYTAKSREEFKYLIQHPLKVRNKINWENIKYDIYSFYSLHNLYCKNQNISKSDLDFINKYRSIEIEKEWNNFVLNYKEESLLINKITSKCLLYFETD